MQICWFKRDLRSQDHEPLQLALADAAVHGSVLPLYLHEPSWWAQPDTSAQHRAFLQECVQSLADDLAKLGATLFEPVGEAVTVFEALWRQRPFCRLISYQETGALHTFERDRAVARWCAERGVQWLQLPQNGVSRGSQFWQQGFDFRAHVRQALEQEPPSLGPSLQWALPPWEDGLVPLPSGDKGGRLKGGRAAALALLADFLEPETLLAYPRAISSPNTAVSGCSRLSPYLAFGVLSDGEVLRRMYGKRAEVREWLSKDRAQDLDLAVKFFLERLYWRAAYHQSFEMNFERAHVLELTRFEHQREAVVVEPWLQAWQDGRTGVPYVDAAMRMLAQTGWLNMRLRGTVVSFALNELWLPWRAVGLHLAREFLDYDCAIHWSQLQIHAGSSKLSEPLTYDPRKQAVDHDPDGVFVRQWVPELRQVPQAYLVEPWNMPPAVQQSSGCRIGVDYPAPLVNLHDAHEAARDRVAALRAGKSPPRNPYWAAREAARLAIVQGSLF